MNELKYALYARKSSENEDRQVQSIDDQINVMTARAEQLGLNVTQHILESHSAKAPNVRPRFRELMTMINDGEVNAILCWQINRLSRNPQESGELQQLLQDGKLLAIQTNDRVFLPDDNAMIFGVETSMANQYVRELMVNVRRGIKSRLENGQMCGKAPIGYLNDRTARTVIPDPERFELVRKLWDLMLTGNYTVSEITRYANESLSLKTRRTRETGGKALSVPGVYSLFKNPYYYGTIRYDGTLYKGNHQVMITESEYDAVQALIRPHSKQKLATKYSKEPFLFRGLVRCAECGCLITYTRKTKRYKNGKTQDFEYCYCTNGRKDVDCSERSTIKPEVLSQMVHDELVKYTIADEFFQWASRQLDGFYEDESTQRQQITRHQTREITKVESSIKELSRMRYRHEVDDTFYVSEKAELEEYLKQLNKDFARQQNENTQWRKEADKLFNFARYAKDDFDSDDDEKKREVLITLGENLTLKRGVLLFQPIKYLVPIAEANKLGALSTVNFGTYADHIKTAPNEAANKLWYTRLDSN